MIAVSAPATERVADHAVGGIARWAQARQLAPVSMAAFSLGFAIIAAAWLTGSRAGDRAIGVAFLLACVLTARVARVMGGPRVTVATTWGRAACVLLAELCIYAGLAGGVTLAGGPPGAASTDGLSGPLGPQLGDGIIGHAGGTGAAGVWLLAVLAAVILALHHVADLCAAGPAASLPRPGSLRLLALGLALLLAGPRAALLVALLLGALGLLYTLVRPRGPMVASTSSIAGYRGDGPLSAWIGGFVNGRLPPMMPLTVGLLVTCMLAALGLGNLPGILVLTPAEAMLLAALGSSHLHDGSRDWRIPPLLQAGEYVFLAAAGYAGHVPAPVTLGLVAVVALRHLDMAYRARNRVPLSWFMSKERTRLPRADWRGLGWEGRMIIAALALLFGITPLAYAVLAAYLGLLSAADYLAGWSNAALGGAGAATDSAATAGSGGHAPVHR
ncbi:MAG TPA: DUF5941 domain-containing protein [Trebonia sp.]